MSLGSNKKVLNLIILFSLVIVVCIFFISGGIKPSFSALIPNSVEVEKDTDLTYYLNVFYDGVDVNGVESSDTTVANINSDVLYVEDKIPVGLTFKGFVTTQNGSIGASKRNDGSSCAGKVIDDTPESNGEWNADNTEYTYHGLHYNANTRTVSFKVDNLQAGCVLTVGVITRTPASVEGRVDFYNYGTARDGETTVKSNLTHVFMGEESPTSYNVKYEYVGTVPTNAPSLPETMTYAEGAAVGVSNNPIMTGYTFSGWTTSDVTVTNGIFDMPTKEVVFKGSFTELPKFKVTYVVTAREGYTLPEDYLLPEEKQYYAGETVKLDALKKGTILNDFQFTGWESEDVTFDNNTFIMPSKDVNISGEFNIPEYKVTYKFYNTNLPSNMEEIYFESMYLKSTMVTLVDVPPVDGYEFLGWYHQDNFIIEEDTVIYGEWRRVLGSFEPTITQVLLSEDKSYEVGEEIKFKVTVTNTSDFEIKDVLIKKNLKDATVSSESEIINETVSYTKIPSIAAKESIDLELKYTVKESDVGKITSEVEVAGAIADNGFDLADSNYGSSATAKLTKELINTPITNKVVFPIIIASIVVIIIGVGLVIYGKKRK